MKRDAYASTRRVLGLALVFWVFSIGKVSAQSAASVPHVVSKVRLSVVQILSRQASYDIFVRPAPAEGVDSEKR